MAALPKDNKNTDEPKKSETTPKTATTMPGLPVRTTQLGEIAIEASQIVSRLEQVAEGNTHVDATPTVFLGPERKKPEEIVQAIQALIAVNEDGEPNSFTPPDEVYKLVLAAHSLAAYCGGLDRPTVRRLSTRFTTDVTRWLSQLFGFLECCVFYHDDQQEGLVRVARMMLHYKYPRYVEDGALAFANNPPMVYSSIASPLGVVQHLCRQLGLPLSCIRPVPVNTHFGSQFTMDVASLQKMMTEDISTGKMPLIVIADVGTPITGHADNVLRIQELCRAHDAWLHLRGHGLAALNLPSYQPNVLMPLIADSFTLTLGSWLGIPSLPMVTLYRLWDSIAASKPARQVGATRESTLPLVAGLSTDHHQGKRILSLPLWAALQALGKEGVHTRLRDNFLACERLWTAVDVYRHVRMLSQRPGGENAGCQVAELVTRPLNVPVLFETTATCVVFQFTPELSEGEVLNRVPPYYDKLNSWLGQILQLDAPEVPIEICDLENIGVVLRFCPFENKENGKQPTQEHIQAFVQCLETQLVILRATIQHKETFVKLVEASPVLRLVELPEWAGLGGVRYVPEGWEQLLTDQAKEELNNLNMALVDALRATDSAFSLGEGVDGLMCVRFGMLTPQSDVEELLNLVIRVGQSVEENSRVLDSMSEIVKKGIETATMDLQKENEERIWQEGILRQVPVVGTFVNWWSPKSKETGVRGRSLNLTQGVVESTENIYKYHMQLPSSGTVAGGRGPPMPSVQTPVGDGRHSRSSSHASSQGTKTVGDETVANSVAQVVANVKENSTEIKGRSAGVRDTKVNGGK